MRQTELGAFLKAETPPDPLLQLAIGRLVTPWSIFAANIVAPPPSNVGALLALGGPVGGGDGAQPTGLDRAAVLTVVVARPGRRLVAITSSLNEATGAKEDDDEKQEREEAVEDEDHIQK